MRKRKTIKRVLLAHPLSSHHHLNHFHNKKHQPNLQRHPSKCRSPSSPPSPPLSLWPRPDATPPDRPSPTATKPSPSSTTPATTTAACSPATSQPANPNPCAPALEIPVSSLWFRTWTPTLVLIWETEIAMTDWAMRFLAIMVVKVRFLDGSSGKLPTTKW